MSFTLGRCPLRPGDTVLFGTVQTVDAFIGRTDLRSCSKISGAHGDEGPVDCWLGVIGGCTVGVRGHRLVPSREEPFRKWAKVKPFEGFDLCLAIIVLLGGSTY